MKVLSRAEQKNVLLSKFCYSDYSIRKMLDNHEIYYLDDDFDECYDYFCYDYFYGYEDLHIFLEKGDEIKVAYIEGMYRNVLIKPDGRIYFIIL